MTDYPGQKPTSPDSSISDSDRLGFYIDLYKQTVETQQHFNDIEWRIRGLALTAATFVLGAAGLAAKDQTTIRGASLGAVVVLVGVILWYAFYFVDRHWYHPLLRASVKHGEVIEQEIQKALPAAGMTQAITEGSQYRPNPIVRVLSGGSKVMHSDDKLVWFYGVGAVALVIVAVGLQGVATFSDSAVEPGSPTGVICLQVPKSGDPRLLACPGPSARPDPTGS